MTQLQLRDFFKAQPLPRSTTHSVIDFTLPDLEEKCQQDNISFHSFTVYRSMESPFPQVVARPLAGTFPTSDPPGPGSEIKPKQRKISDFNDYLLEKEAAPTVATERSTEIVGRQASRFPFSQLQIRQASQVQSLQKKKPAKLDEYFKSICIVEKSNGENLYDNDGDASLGKRKDSGEEERAIKRVQQSKKIRPLDSFVVRVKRNTIANCCM